MKNMHLREVVSEVEQVMKDYEDEHLCLNE